MFDYFFFKKKGANKTSMITENILTFIKFFIKNLMRKVTILNFCKLNKIF